tara:strand:+ start:203 stop:1132 length:930 start_codon:yes stop_codon:yes gene_type:complete
MKTSILKSFETVIKFLSLYVPYFYRVLSLLPNKRNTSIGNTDIPIEKNYWRYIYVNFFLYVSRFNKSKSKIEREVSFSIGTERFHYKLNINENTQCGIYFNLPNPDLVKLIRKSGGTFLDIGANVGFFSILASRYFTNVISFEPSKRTIQSFKENIKLNHSTNITLVECGLSDREGEMNLNENPLNAGGNSFEEFDKEMVASSMRQDWNSYSVPVSTLDNYVLSNNVKKIDLIKIDVESHEPYVIRGAIKTISQFKPIIYLEIGGKKSFLDQIAAEIPEYYELINPETMARLNKNDNLPWDVVFAPKEV